MKQNPTRVNADNLLEFVTDLNLIHCVDLCTSNKRAYSVVQFFIKNIYKLYF